MIRPQPPIQSLVYDEEGVPMTVVGVSADGTYTLMYEAGSDSGFYRLMGEDELYLCLCRPYPAGTYDVVIEVLATKTVRVTSDRLADLKRDMVPGTDTPPIPLGDFMVMSMRPIRIVPVS
jgi:hypothetical protein